MFELADLLKLAENNRIKIETCRLPFGINSIYTELKECPAIICLEQSLSAPQIKIELALCLGYYFLRGQKQLAKEEKRSRAEEWAYSKLAPVEIFTQAFAAGASDIEGIANYAGVTPEFIRSRPILRRAAGTIYNAGLILRDFRTSKHCSEILKIRYIIKIQFVYSAKAVKIYLPVQTRPSFRRI